MQVDYNNGASAVEWVAVLDKLLALDFDIVIPGHGALLVTASPRAAPQSTCNRD